MGPPKQGKSFLALQVALAVAQGRDFLGQKSVPGTVWYLQLDTSEAIWRARIQRLDEGGEDMTGPVLLAHPADIPRPYNISTMAFQAFVRDALKECDPVLVIVDVLRKVHSADENDSTEMKRVFDILGELFEGRSLFLVHHTKKIKEDTENPDPNNVSRGSSFITGDADALWLLFNRKLKIVSRFDEDLMYRAERLPSGLWRFPDIIHRTEAQERALSLCAEYPEKSHGQLAEVAETRWGMSRASYYRYLGGQVCAHSSPVEVGAESNPDTNPKT